VAHPFRQYTSCVSPGNFVDLSFTLLGAGMIGLLLFSTQVVGILLASLLGGPALIWVAIALDSAFIIFFEWWLNGRLICLGGERCLIGVIGSLGPSNPVNKGGDNDFNVDLLLAPGPTNYTFPNEYYWHAYQGELVAPNPQILAISRGYETGDDHKEYIGGLHCKFEGDGILMMLALAKMILGVLIAALIFPAIAPLLEIFAAILFLIGLLGGWLLNTPGGIAAGNPTDIDPNLGTMGRGDIVVIKGDWVYDSLHPGWNEIHAVHDCQIVGHMDLPDTTMLHDPRVPQTPWPLGLDDPIGVQAALDFWCKGITDAGAAEEGGSHEDPQNDWVIHPIIDGCNPVVIV
jgi:hypothetical protein